MGTYKVPDDYDYLTGGFLETDDNGNVTPGQMTPKLLNQTLFPHMSREQPYKDDDGMNSQQRYRIKQINSGKCASGDGRKRWGTRTTCRRCALAARRRALLSLGISR